MGAEEEGREEASRAMFVLSRRCEETAHHRNNLLLGVLLRGVMHCQGLISLSTWTMIELVVDDSGRYFMLLAVLLFFYAGADAVSS
jgi:hypothetical protein